MHSRLQAWLECCVWNSSIPLINWEAVTADLKSCGGNFHLMQHWMAGHTTTKALSHSYEAYLITVPQRAICLCLTFFFPADICSSPALSLSLSPLSLSVSLSLSLSSMLKTNRTLSKHFAQPLVLLHLPHYCRVQKCSMIPLSGLFENISDLRQGCHWQWTRKNYEKMMMGLTSLEIGRTEW